MLERAANAKRILMSRKDRSATDDNCLAELEAKARTRERVKIDLAWDISDILGINHNKAEELIELLDKRYQLKDVESE